MIGEDQFTYLHYLIEGATLNDYLLQSYRNFHLILQSIFLAIGTGLFIAILSFNEIQKSTIASIILFALFLISFFILIKMYKIIIARGKDVNFWHRKIIGEEQNLSPDKRYFTKFKIHQRLRRSNTNDLQKLFLSEKKVEDHDINHLVEKGLGHTRKILDKWLFVGLGIIWLLLISISLGYTILLNLT